MRLADYRSFAAALCDAALPPPSALQVAPGNDIRERFAIYRNNLHVSLVDALAERFPVVLALVGEDFFRAMARDYVVAHKPVSPVLTHYGQDFPDYVASHEPAATLPFLGDIARLEREWSQAWAAADEPALDRAALAACSAAELAAARIRPHAAARLLRSAWPVADLWQAHQHVEPDLSAMEWRAQNVLITRPDAEVRLQRLDAGSAMIAQALFDGRSIAEAAAESEDADTGAVLALLLDSGTIAEVLKA